MIYLIFDTNIWLYLANGYDSEKKDFPKGIFSNHHFELLETLKENVLNNNFKILVNDIILKEWHRNQKSSESLLKLVWNRKSEIQKSKKTLNAFIPKEDKKEFEELIKKATNNVETLITRNKDHIKQVEDFLKNECIVIPISDEIKVKVTDLRLAKSTAPFTTNKDNFLDALILYSSAEYLKDKLSLDFARAIFVSNNYLEFATKDNDKEFHPDILNIIGET